MSQPVGHRNWTLCAARSLFIATLLCGASIGFAAESPAPSPTAQEQQNQPAETDDVQERGVMKLPPVKGLTDKRLSPKPAQPGGSPPAHLCHTETRQLTQCKCFNQTECQALTALFPNSCPAGSTNCAFVPMARGSMPPLPPNLCGYQVPLTVTECACHNAKECQQLTPFCPSSCPAGSQNCTCRPMQRR